MTINSTLLNQDPKLAEIVSRIVAEFNPTRIFLFGSRARNDSTEDSDYDILVVIPHSEMPNYKLAQQAYRKLRGIHVPIDVVVITERQFEVKKLIIGTIPESAVHEGKELYVA